MMQDQTMVDPTDFAAVFSRLAEAGKGEQTVTLGGVNIRMVRVVGGVAGRWDSHPHTTETVLVWSGDFHVEFQDHAVSLQKGQCCVIPIDTGHRGTSRDGAEVILFTQAT